VVKTKDPTFDFEAAGQAIGGNEDYSQFSAMVSGPVIEDQVAVRLAVDRSQRESFVEGVVAYPETDDPDRFESTTLRAKLLVEPAALEDFSALVTVNHTDNRGPQTETVTRPFDEHVVSYPQMNVFLPRSTSGIVETTWDISDTLSFETTLSATDLRVKRLAAPGDGNAEINGHELVVEPRLRFDSSDGRFEGVAGAYLFRAAQDESILLSFISADRGRFDDNTATEAVFAEGTYEILEDIDLTAGARLEQENRRREGAVGVFSVDLDETNRMFLPKLGLAWHATDELTLGAMVSKGYNGGGAGFTFDVPFRNFVFEEEEVWTYEAYGRADLDGGRLALTGNVFFSDYKNFQLSYDGNPDPDIWSVFIRNVDKVHTYGAELGVTWLATPELELFGGIGLLHTEVIEDSQATIEGNELPRAPAFTIDVGAIYRHSSGLELSADARFSDSFQSSIDNAAGDKIDPYVVVNAQAGYRLNDNLRGFAFVTNLFDSSDEVLLEPGATRADDAASILRPRSFGIGLQVNF
jgi:outer membrane receptor protein involved in Fe transport